MKLFFAVQKQEIALSVIILQHKSEFQIFTFTMTSFTMNVYSTFILLLQYFAVKIMYYPFFFSPSFYRHSFIPFILRNFYDFHLFFSFTFDFYYYKTISRDFFLQMNFQGIRTDHYTFVDHKMFQNTTCRGFISLAYVA